MGVLTSTEFAGDPKLEACAVSDPAHVTPGSVGNHVGKIQNALIKVDGAAISETERAERRYGASTTQAVVNFKQRRNILNYAGKIDNIVGKKTIRALDEGLRGASPRPAPKPPGPPPKPIPWNTLPIPGWGGAPGPPMLPAILTRATGDVEVRVPGASTVKGAPGMALPKNTVVNTLADGDAEVFFPSDGTRVVLKPHSTLVIYGPSTTWPPPTGVDLDLDALRRGLEALRKGQVP